MNKRQRYKSPKRLWRSSLNATLEGVRKARERAKQIALETLGPEGDINKVLEEAKKLALDAKESDPNIVKAYWFPDEHEVHLILVDENTIVSPTDFVEPFYFDASEEVPVPSGTAVIRPSEYGKLELPDGWGDWKDGQELEIGN
jgi:hypothetical protein